MTGRRAALASAVAVLCWLQREPESERTPHRATGSAATGEEEAPAAEAAVAALDDIIRSKAAADRPKDRATLPILYALKDEIEQRER